MENQIMPHSPFFNSIYYRINKFIEMLSISFFTFFAEHIIIYHFVFQRNWHLLNKADTIGDIIIVI